MTKTHEDKISEPLKARLSQMGAEDIMTAIVITRHASGSGKRLDQRRRSGLIRSSRKAAGKARTTLAAALAEHEDGEVLPQDLGALGGVVVRATRRGLETLAQRSDVKAILEDQKVSVGG